MKQYKNIFNIKSEYDSLIQEIRKYPWFISELKCSRARNGIREIEFKFNP